MSLIRVEESQTIIIISSFNLLLLTTAMMMIAAACKFPRSVIGGLSMARRWASLGHAPKVFLDHLDMIRRNADAFPTAYLDPRNAPAMNKLLGQEDAKVALANFERVTGIAQDDVREIMAYTGVGQIEGDIKRLLTWKDFPKAKDIFVPGLGPFDITECLQEVMRKSKKKIYRIALAVFQDDYLRALRNEKLGGRCERGRGSRFDWQDSLADEAENLDFAAMLSKAPKVYEHSRETRMSPYLKKELWRSIFYGKILSGYWKPFWLAENLDLAAMLSKAPKVYEHSRETRMSPYHKKELWRSIFYGKILSGYWKPFWLPTVREIRTQAYFGKSFDPVSAFEPFWELMFEPKGSPQREYLIKHRNKWSTDYSFDTNKFLILVKSCPIETWNELGLAKLAPKNTFRVLKRLDRQESPPFWFLEGSPRRRWVLCASQQK